MDVSGGSDVEVAVMAEAGDDDSDDDEDNNSRNPGGLYTYEGIYRDAADKARLMAMTEIERESELADRRETLQASEDRRALERMVAAQQGPVQGDNADSSDDGSKPSAMARRKGAAGERGKKLDELKRKRQDKSARDEKRQRRANGEDAGESDDGYTKQGSKAWDFSDDDEDVENQRPGKSGRSGKGKGAASDDEAGPEVREVEEILPALLQRGRLIEYWPREWFPEYVKNAYVRISVGQHNGISEYRLSQIVGVAEKKATQPYTVDGQRTDIKLTLSVGEQTQDFKLDMISNSPLIAVRGQACGMFPLGSLSAIVHVRRKSSIATL